MDDPTGKIEVTVKTKTGNTFVFYMEVEGDYQIWKVEDADLYNAWIRIVGNCEGKENFPGNLHRTLLWIPVEDITYIKVKEIKPVDK